MEEYTTEAVVLAKHESGEADTVITLYTRALGKVRAIARSSRKITSKLAGHLEPSSLVTVRLARRKMFHVADALMSRRFPNAERILAFLAHHTEHGADERTWNVLMDTLEANEREERMHIGSLLQTLGYDPAFAACATCGITPTQYVTAANLDFYCGPCADRIGTRTPAEFLSVAEAV
ncbi:MAG: recombination protein O N-terminal domain-containing protein [Candidatus Liptonbacteria bacterium]|nr:recombination protein O N-terminal domain-containing protein [Candidatus Liptonbacteria bacterium]